MAAIHFISGLPRSGSTLLAALLRQNPRFEAKTMRAIYSFLGEPDFEHDFGHVDYDVTEFDERAGTPGLHTVRGEVKAHPRQTVLPPDLFDRFIHDAFWRDPDRIPDGLRVV